MTLRDQNYQELSLVQSIDLIYLKSLPPILQLSAKGSSSTLGWSDIRLEKHEYIMPPQDGIQEFTLMGMPPAQGSGEAIDQHESSPFYWPLDEMPDWVKGIRIIAAANQLTRPLYEYSAVELPLCFDDTPADQLTEVLTELVEPANQAQLEIKSSKEQQGLLLTGTCVEVPIMTTKNWPETKIEWENKCISILGNEVCTKLPVTYTRTSRIGFFASICHPASRDFERVITDCAKEAIVAGGIVAVVTGGNLAAAAVAMKEYMIKCLVSRGLEQLSNISVDIQQKKKPGNWHKL